MFGFLNSGNNPPAPAPSNTPPAPTPENTPPVNTPPAPVPPTNTPPVPEGPRNLNLWSMLVGDPQQQQQQQQQQAQTPEDRAAAFLSAMLSGATQQGLAAETGAPAINPEKLAAALPAMGLSAGIDFNELAQGLAGQEPGKAVENLVGAVQQSTIMAMVPMMNELVRQAMEAATTKAVTDTHHTLTSSAVVTAFNERYGYGSHPAVSPMLTQFANGLAQSAPRGTTPAQLADALHNMFQSMGSGLRGGDADNRGQQGRGTNNFTDLFK